MPSKSHIQRIHIAKAWLKLSDEAYYAMLSVYSVESSKELTDSQANDLLNTFQKMGWNPGKKYHSMGNRPDNYATPKQLRYIDALWNGFARNPTPTALRAFVQRITGKSDLKFISKKEASTLIKAITTMKNDSLNKHLHTINEDLK